jgi:hypothetical protein
VAAKPAPFEIDADALLALPEPERSEELAKVARLKRQLEGNPLWGYVPHNQGPDGGQVRFHQASPDDVFLAAVVAGNRFGKTHAGVVDNLIQILPPELLPPWLVAPDGPGGRRPVDDDAAAGLVVDLLRGDGGRRAAG